MIYYCIVSAKSSTTPTKLRNDVGRDEELSIFGERLEQLMVPYAVTLEKSPRMKQYLIVFKSIRRRASAFNHQ